MIHHDTPSLCIKNCELCIVNCAINVNLGAAGVAGATYFLFCYIYARANAPILSCTQPRETEITAFDSFEETNPLIHLFLLTTHKLYDTL